MRRPRLKCAAARSLFAPHAHPPQRWPRSRGVRGAWMMAGGPQRAAHRSRRSRAGDVCFLRRRRRYPPLNSILSPPRSSLPLHTPRAARSSAREANIQPAFASRFEMSGFRADFHKPVSEFSGLRAGSRAGLGSIGLISTRFGLVVVPTCLARQGPNFKPMLDRACRCVNVLVSIGSNVMSYDSYNRHLGLINAPPYYIFPPNDLFHY